MNKYLDYIVKFDFERSENIRKKRNKQSIYQTPHARTHTIFRDDSWSVVVIVVVVTTRFGVHLGWYPQAKRYICKNR